MKNAEWIAGFKSDYNLLRVTIGDYSLKGLFLQVTTVVKRIEEVEKIYFYGVLMYGSKLRATSKLLGRKKGQTPR
jgi:hypothetical protein